MAHRSAPLCGTPFIWRTPCGASSVPTSDSCYEYSECVDGDRVWTANPWVKIPECLQQDHPGSMQAFSTVRCPCNRHISLSPFELKMFQRHCLTGWNVQSGKHLVADKVKSLIISLENIQKVSYIQLHILWIWILSRQFTLISSHMKNVPLVIFSVN